MTVVNIDLAEPDGKPLTGCLDFKPTARFADGAQLRLPTPVQVRLLDGLAAPDLPPSEPGWVWQVTERVNGGTRRHVQIPAGGPVAYADLSDIDPATLEPATSASPAWVSDLAAVTDSVGALEQTTTGLAETVAAKADAATVATLTNQIATLHTVAFDTDGTPYIS